MAERRMFAKTIIDSDNFLDMPLSAQALYFHLSMRADDEGFINNPKKIQRMVNASDDDARILMARGFVIPFDSGIVVIKHWKIHNYIQRDRMKPTLCQDELSMLEVGPSKAYEMAGGSANRPAEQLFIQNGYTMDTCCEQNVYNSDTQVRLGESSLGEISLGETSKNTPSKTKGQEDRELEEEFAELWKLYPRKEGKKDALRHYKASRRRGATADEVRDGIKALNEQIARKNTAHEYIPQGSTWFCGERWNDDYNPGPHERQGYEAGCYMSHFQ